MRDRSYLNKMYNKMSIFWGSRNCQTRILGWRDLADTSLKRFSRVQENIWPVLQRAKDPPCAPSCKGITENGQTQRWDLAKLERHTGERGIAKWLVNLRVDHRNLPEKDQHESKQGVSGLKSWKALHDPDRQASKFLTIGFHPAWLSILIIIPTKVQHNLPLLCTDWLQESLHLHAPH